MPAIPYNRRQMVIFAFFFFLKFGLGFCVVLLLGAVPAPFFACLSLCVCECAYIRFGILTMNRKRNASEVFMAARQIRTIASQIHCQLFGRTVWCYTGNDLYVPRARHIRFLIQKKSCSLGSYTDSHLLLVESLTEPAFSPFKRPFLPFNRWFTSRWLPKKPIFTIHPKRKKAFPSE